MTAPVARLIRSDYQPWWAQAALHRSEARFRIVVAGRGVGKTHAAAFELLQMVLTSPPGSEGAVLAPTLTHAEAAERALKEHAALIPGVSFRAQKRRLLLPGGRSVKIFSADRKESVRGPSLVALWVDEGAYVSVLAIEAALPALRSVGVETRLLVTTTPAGKNWVWDWWERAADPNSGIERFRFRATDSPYQDQFMLEQARQLMSPEKFAQEYMAEFVDSLLLVFPERDGLFLPSFPERKGRVDCWIGVDLGRSQDWTVLTLMNEHGETRVLARVQAGVEGFRADTFWAQTDRMVLAACKEHGAMAVIDTGGPGGAPGARLAEFLRSEQVPTLGVNTGSPGTKTEIVEQLRSDVEWERVRILRNRHTKQLDYELSRFQGIRRVVRGREQVTYEGPQIPGEFDDMVISLCLANWGRDRADRASDPTKGDFSGFGGVMPASRVGGVRQASDSTKPPGKRGGGFGGFGGFGGRSTGGQGWRNPFSS